MKRIALFTIFLLLIGAVNSFSQEDKIYYINGTMELVVLDENQEIISEKPMGRDVLIAYDRFFKSYDIIFTMEDGSGARFHFTYLTTENDGTKRYGDTFNAEKSVYLLDDRIKDLGTLILIGEKTRIYENGKTLISSMIIKNLKLKTD